MAKVFRCDRCKEYQDDTKRYRNGKHYGTVVYHLIAKDEDDDEIPRAAKSSELCESCFDSVRKEIETTPAKALPG